MSRVSLEKMALINRQHAEDGTLELAKNIVEIPASNYYDLDRWNLEIEKIFKRLPLVLGLSKELPNIGDFKALN